MKTLLRFLPGLPLLLVALHAVEPDSRLISAVRAADDERVGAFIAADRARLNAIFSDDLRYGHATGAVDNKAAYINLLTSGQTQYFSLNYDERNFTFPSPQIALMTGRVQAKASSAGKPIQSVLGFLAVWREEKGKWRLLAWQGCFVAPPATPAK